MINLKRTGKWIACAAGVILLLMLGTALVAPKIINTAVMKEKLLRDLSRKIAGTVTFRSIDVSLFPVPRLIIEEVDISLPRKMEAKIASLKVYPQIMPLLRGEVRISKLQADYPAIMVSVSDKETHPLSVEEISTAIRKLVSDTAGLTVIFKNGSLSLGRIGQVPASLQQVDARVLVNSSKNGLTVTLDSLKVATPRLMLSGELSILPSSPRLSLDLRGKGVAVGPLRDFALSVAQEVPSVRNVFNIIIDGTVPAISFHSQGDSFKELGATMNIEIKGELEEGKIHVQGPGLDFTAVKGQCVLSKGILVGTDITGRYGNSDLQEASLKLGVKGRDAPFHLETLVRADLAEVRILLQRLVKDKSFSDEFSLVQSLSGTARGRLVLGESISSVRVRVMVSDMNFSSQYQRIPFPVTIKGGAFAYDEKQVSVKDLAGTMGQTSFSGIAARMDHGKNPRLAVLSGKLRIHAGELYGWLSSVEKLRPSLKDITEANGMITISSLEVNGPALSPQEWIVNTVGAAEGLTVTSPLIPAPLILSSGDFSYNQNGFSVKELSAAMGRSSAANLDAQLQTGDIPYLTIRSARAIIDTGEMYRWLAAHEKMKTSLRDISAVSGSITFSAVALQGPVSVPNEWQFTTSGTVDNLSISASSLPESLILKQGKFRLSPRQIVLEGMQAGMLDTAATISGTLTVSQEGTLGYDVLVDAETGPKGMQWIKTAAGLSPMLKVQQRLSLARSSIVKSEKGDLSFQGRVTTDGGQTLLLELMQEKKELKIRKLDIADAVSRASVTLDLRERSFDVSFSGRLNSSTLAALMELEQLPAGNLAGDFSAHILKDRPAECTARGSLTGEKIVLPWKPGIPLHIDAVSVNAEGNRIDILSSRLRFSDTALSSRGTLTFGKDGMDVNMDVDADRIDWKSLEKIMKDEKPAEPAADKGRSSGMLVSGRAKISAREFVYEKYMVSPLQVDVSFSPGQASAEIKKASLCGISAQGNIGLTGGEQNMVLTFAARDDDLKPSVTCLLGIDSEITGRFSLDSRITLSLKSSPPLSGLEGTVSFRAREGRINKSIPLSSIFSLLTVTEYFRGLPDLRKEGFSYSTFTINGDIHQGILSLKELVLDGSTVEITAEGTVNLSDRKTDITVLAAPFKTMDAMIRLLPERKGDSNTSLISVGVKVTGDYKNPTVSVQPLSGISRGLSGTMERMLMAPIRIIEPLIP